MKKKAEIDDRVIIAAIEEAERHTSGEIRVHIENQCPEEVLDRAAYWFQRLGMHRTKQRNGVLIYLALLDHKFAIIGDVAIHQKVSSDFWEKTKEEMLQYFRKGEITQGLAKGILRVGYQLREHFPYDPHTDENELSNEISRNDLK